MLRLAVEIICLRVFSATYDPYIFTAIAVVFLVIIFSTFKSQSLIVSDKLRKFKFKNFEDINDKEIAKLRGKVIFCRKTLNSPLSNSKCVYYRVIIDQEINDFKDGRNLRTEKIIDEEVFGEIIIENNGKYALIETKFVNSYIVNEKEYKSGFLNDATPELNKFLKKYGYSSKKLYGTNYNTYYKEKLVTEHQEVVALGICNWHKASQFNLKLPVDDILVMSSNMQIPIYLSDDSNLIS